MTDFLTLLQDSLRSFRTRTTWISIQANDWMNNFGKFLKFVALYLAFAGVFGFAVFIAQEGCQMLSFAQFSASDTRSYGLMKENLEIMQDINNSIKFMTRWFLWLVPPQQAGYTHYGRATDQYIKTLTAEVLANEPILYIGEHISMTFMWNTYAPAKNGLYIAENKRIKVILPGPPDSKSIQVAGIARPDPAKKDGIIIDMSGL